MFISETTIRVRYAETDQMDIVYYGNYAQYFEVGRAESIRQLGYTYKDMEAMGIRMPVVEFHAEFKRPAHYDDLITVKTILKKLKLKCLYSERGCSEVIAYTELESHSMKECKYRNRKC